MLPLGQRDHRAELSCLFQWAPTLGGECYDDIHITVSEFPREFQWAPTLGGECYHSVSLPILEYKPGFNGHPPLGVNATPKMGDRPRIWGYRFNGHPPLGVNATGSVKVTLEHANKQFQWAPTLGGECYYSLTTNALTR